MLGFWGDKIAQGSFSFVCAFEWLRYQQVFSVGKWYFLRQLKLSRGLWPKFPVDPLLT